MYRDTKLFQGTHQALKTVGQADGRGGIGQQEGAGNQHQDSAHHEYRPFQALGGDGKRPQPQNHLAAIGVKQVQYAGEDYDNDQRLHAPDNGFQRNPGNPDAAQQEHKHQTVGQPASRDKQGHDVEYRHHQLGSGVQPVNHGIPREILAQGNIFKHAESPLSAP